MEEIKYVGSIEELLDASEPSDPRNTAVALLRLPVTRGLQPRYAFVFAGDAAEHLVRLHASVMEQIAEKTRAG